jgi:acyl-CoA thioester hydrolase
MESEVPDRLSGELADGGHRLLQRVYYEDTDFSGVVYHARYLHFLERGRTDYLRCLGVRQGDMMADENDAGAAFVVRRMLIDFLSAARMDDVLEIFTKTLKITGARLVLEQRISVGDRALVTAEVTVALVNSMGRARRMPDRLAALFFT